MNCAAYSFLHPFHTHSDSSQHLSPFVTAFGFCSLPEDDSDEHGIHAEMTHFKASNSTGLKEPNEVGPLQTLDRCLLFTISTGLVELPAALLSLRFSHSADCPESEGGSGAYLLGLHPTRAAA